MLVAGPILAAAVAEPSPPVLPRAFTVTLKQTFEPVRFALGQPALWAAPSTTMTFVYDSSYEDGTLRQRTNASRGFASTVWTLFTPGNSSLRIFAKFANDCRPLPPQFTFGQGFTLHWVQNATFVGTVHTHGKLADQFFYTDTVGQYNYTLAVERGGSTRLLYVISTWIGSLPGTSHETSLTLRHEFMDDMRIGPVDDEMFRVPVSGCFEKVPPCSDGEIVHMDVYLAHPHQFNYLENEDTADARGDVIFLCPDMISTSGAASFNLYDRVSHWIIEVDTRWGQYQRATLALRTACRALNMHSSPSTPPLPPLAPPLTCSPGSRRVQWLPRPLLWPRRFLCWTPNSDGIS